MRALTRFALLLIVLCWAAAASAADEGTGPEPRSDAALAQSSPDGTLSQDDDSRGDDEASAAKRSDEPKHLDGRPRPNKDRADTYDLPRRSKDGGSRGLKSHPNHEGLTYRPYYYGRTGLYGFKYGRPYPYGRFRPFGFTYRPHYGYGYGHGYAAPFGLLYGPSYNRGRIRPFGFGYVLPHRGGHHHDRGFGRHR